MIPDQQDNPSHDAHEPSNKPSVHNELATAAPNVVVQAGTISGGIHHHAVDHQAPVPRQLPLAPPGFVGRVPELALLTAGVDEAGQLGSTVVISALRGSGGIGKTWLAVHWAHQQLNRFPDGQLYVNLRGFDPSGKPMPTEVAVRGFLDGLGVAPTAIPVDLDAQAALYRSLVAGKRMLIVLDNVRDTAQVVALLPGSPTCTVLVTSRYRLTGLATTHGARLLDLDVLPDIDARDLLARHLGSARLDAEPTAVAELLTICAGLPLALRITAARAEHHLDFPLAVLAEELRETSVRLEALDVGDLHANLGAVLSWSYRALTAQPAHLFRLLGIVPGPDISLHATASLSGLPIAQTRSAMRELENASLVRQPMPDRYRMHDLIRLYAAQQAAYDLSSDVRTAALQRLVDFYVHTAHAGDRRLAPLATLVDPGPPSAGCHPQALADDTAALTWFDREHHCLLAGQQTAAEYGWHQAVWHLAWTLSTYQMRRGHLHDAVAAWRAGLAAATHLADPTAHIVAHRCLGSCLAHIRRDDEAWDHLQQSLALANQAEDHYQQALAHQTLATASDRRGDDRQALDHANDARRRYHSLGDLVREAIALTLVGRYTARLGEYEKARAHCQAALILHRHHRYPTGEADALDSLGYVDQHTGHHASALDHYHNALALRRTLGNTYAVANNLDAIGHPYVALGQSEQAMVVWREAKELYRRQGRLTEDARIQRQLDDLDERLALQNSDGS